MVFKLGRDYLAQSDDSVADVAAELPTTVRKEEEHGYLGAGREAGFRAMCRIYLTIRPNAQRELEPIRNEGITMDDILLLATGFNLATGRELLLVQSGEDWREVREISLDGRPCYGETFRKGLGLLFTSETVDARKLANKFIQARR